MIILCWIFLIAFVLLKTIPQLANHFAIAINNENIVKAGHFIDNHIWLERAIYFGFTLATYHFYLCACCHKWHLTLIQYLIIFAILIPMQFANIYIPTVACYLNFVLMFTIPYFLKADYRTVMIIFATHTLGQLAISYIRSEALLCVDINFLSQTIMLIDMYVWLLLYYLYSNLYKEKKFMGQASPPLWDKMAPEIKAELKRVDEEISKCQDEKKLAKLRDKKAVLENELKDAHA